MMLENADRLPSVDGQRFSFSVENRDEDYELVKLGTVPSRIATARV